MNSKIQKTSFWSCFKNNISTIEYFKRKYELKDSLEIKNELPDSFGKPFSYIDIKRSKSNKIEIVKNHVNLYTNITNGFLISHCGIYDITKFKIIEQKQSKNVKKILILNKEEKYDKFKDEIDIIILSNFDCRYLIYSKEIKK